MLLDWTFGVIEALHLIIHPLDVEAIEVYTSPARLPEGYDTGADVAGAVILIRRRRISYFLHCPPFLITMLIGVLVLSQGAPLEAQRLSGRLIEVDSEDPVGAGLVTLLRGDSVPLTTTVSDNDGEWTLEADDPGFYFINVKRLGYKESLVGPLKLEDDGALSGVFRLERLPVALEPIEVSAVAVVRRLDDVGFYRRQSANRGYFMDREKIEMRLGASSDPAHLLSAVPGVTLVEPSTGVGNARIRLHRGVFSFAGCSGGPRIFVDGFETEDIGAIGPPENIVGIEVYRTPSQIPVQYGGPMSACGVLLVWTLAGGR
jgi:hypothetical protein